MLYVNCISIKLEEKKKQQKNPIKKPHFTPQRTRKKRQTKQKVSRRNEVAKIRAGKKKERFEK